MALRARVILLAASGLSLKEIASETGLSFRICHKWCKRFLELRLEGLQDKPGRGRALSISPEERVALVALACTTPPDGSSRWSVRKLAEATGHSKSAIQRILAVGAIKPHKTKYWCGKSPDPEFQEKQAAILGLYLNPPEKALVLCVDEKSQIQALDRTQPLLPMRPGNPKRLTATHKRNGTTCLLAALAMHSGTIEGRCVESSNHEEFLKFLKTLCGRYLPPNTSYNSNWLPSSTTRPGGIWKNDVAFHAFRDINAKMTLRHWEIFDVPVARIVSRPRKNEVE